MTSPLITAEQLNRSLDSDTPPVVVDTRFSLADPEQGRREFTEAHIPTARYAQLDEDLSAPAIPGKTGRHPLPNPAEFAVQLGRWGISNTTPVVVYDGAAGGIAARLWWMLRWLGHSQVSVLDGGWAAWRRAGFEISSEPPDIRPAAFFPKQQTKMAVDADAVMDMRIRKRITLLDARSADRYAGKNETIDPIAGHIPGAVSGPYMDTVHPDGTSRSPAELLAHFRTLLDGADPENVVVYCGSGVTAARAILAMEAAGLPGAKLYPGSWSEWITLQ